MADDAELDVVGAAAGAAATGTGGGVLGMPGAGACSSATSAIGVHPLMPWHQARARGLACA
jgi:hypothetical protein